MLQPFLKKKNYSDSGVNLDKIRNNFFTSVPTNQMFLVNFEKFTKLGEIQSN